MGLILKPLLSQCVSGGETLEKKEKKERGIFSVSAGEEKTLSPVPSPTLQPMGLTLRRLRVAIKHPHPSEARIANQFAFQYDGTLDISALMGPRDRTSISTGRDDLSFASNKRQHSRPNYRPSSA